MTNDLDSAEKSDWFKDKPLPPRNTKPLSPRAKALKDLQAKVPEIRLMLITDPEKAAPALIAALTQLKTLVKEQGESDNPDEDADWLHQTDVLDMSLTNFLAEALRDRGRWEDAANAYLRCITLGEKLQQPEFQAESLLNLGKAYRHANNLKYARRSFDRAVIISQLYGLFSTEAEAFYQLAVVAELNQEPEEALKHYREGLNLSEGQRLYALIIRFQSQLGQLCQEIGDYPQALKHYQACLKLLEKEEDLESQVIIIGQISHIYAETNEYELGISLAERGLELSRQTGQTAEEAAFLGDLARMHITGEMRTQARRYAQEALAHAEKRQDAGAKATAQKMLEEIEEYFNMGATRDANEATATNITFTGLSESFSATPEMHYQRGNQYYQDGAFDRAISAYSRAIHLDSSLVNAYINRGSAYNAKANFDRALADFTKALELTPTDPIVYFNRGNTYRKRREYELALVDYSKALELDPADTDTYFNRGEVYRRLDRRNEAIADFRRVIKLSNPDDQPAINAARRMLGELGSTTNNLKPLNLPQG